MKLDAISIGTLWRLSFRLFVAVAFALLWPRPAPGLATAALLFLLAVGCLVTALAYGEAPFGASLNRWHEAAALFTISCVVLLAS